VHSHNYLTDFELFHLAQVVALRGTNPTGKRFVATDIYCAPCSHGNVVVGDKANIDSKKGMLLFAKNYSYTTYEVRFKNHDFVLTFGKGVYN